MTADTTSKSPGVAEYYDRAAASIPQFTVLNYGFSSATEQSVIAPDEPEFYCLRLYEHSIRNTAIAGSEVLEVSCGRGGGASFIFSKFHPRRYVGVDLSTENIRIGRERDDGPEFVIGNAEQLDFAAATFDVVINIEASHLYDDRKQFFGEVFRVLKPDGTFCYTDGCWADDDCSEDLLNAGFELTERLEITANVIRALQLDSARKEALFDAMSNTDLIQEFKDWGGIVGYRAYQRFIEGQTRYFSHLLRRP